MELREIYEMDEKEFRKRSIEQQRAFKENIPSTHQYVICGIISLLRFKKSKGWEFKFTDSDNVYVPYDLENFYERKFNDIETEIVDQCFDVLTQDNLIKREVILAPAYPCIKPLDIWWYDEKYLYFKGFSKSFCNNIYFQLQDIKARIDKIEQQIQSVTTLENEIERLKQMVPEWYKPKKD